MWTHLGKFKGVNWIKCAGIAFLLYVLLILGSCTIGGTIYYYTH